MPERPDQQALSCHADQPGENDGHQQTGNNRQTGSNQGSRYKHGQSPGITNREIYGVGRAKNNHNAKREQSIGRTAYYARENDGRKVTHGYDAWQVARLQKSRRI